MFGIKSNINVLHTLYNMTIQVRAT